MFYTLMFSVMDLQIFLALHSGYNSKDANDTYVRYRVHLYISAQKATFTHTECFVRLLARSVSLSADSYVDRQ